MVHKTWPCYQLGYYMTPQKKISKTRMRMRGTNVYIMTIVLVLEIWSYTVDKPPHSTLLPNQEMFQSLTYFVGKGPNSVPNLYMSRKKETQWLGSWSLGCKHTCFYNHAMVNVSIVSFQETEASATDISASANEFFDQVLVRICQKCTKYISKVRMAYVLNIWWVIWIPVYMVF